MTSAAARAAGAEPVRLALAAMGTRFEVVLHGAEPVRLRAVGESALAEIESCHQRFSRFAPDSLVSHLQRVAHLRPVRLDADTYAMFEDALHVHRLSRGAFDVAVAPLTDAAKTGADTDPARPGMDAIVLDPSSCTLRFSGPGVRLDLGAIAKGHGLDLAARAIRECGVDSALIHGGTSSVIGIGAPPGSDGWRIALAQTPDADPIRLRDGALSVSTTRGDAAARPDGGTGHLVDPRTGHRLAIGRAVAVIGPSARLADAWATAIAVLGHQPEGLGREWTVQLFEAGTA